MLSIMLRLILNGQTQCSELIVMLGSAVVYIVRNSVLLSLVNREYLDHWMNATTVLPLTERRS